MQRKNAYFYLFCVSRIPFDTSELLLLLRFREYTKAETDSVKSCKTKWKRGHTAGTSDNIERDFFWNSNVLLRPLSDNQQYAAVKHELIESEAVSRGKFPFSCWSPTHRGFRVKGQPLTPYEGWICAKRFFHLMGRLWNNRGVGLRTAPFEAGGDRESSPKALSLCWLSFILSTYYLTVN